MKSLRASCGWKDNGNEMHRHWGKRVTERRDREEERATDTVIVVALKGCACSHSVMVCN